ITRVISGRAIDRTWSARNYPWQQEPSRAPFHFERHDRPMTSRKYAEKAAAALGKMLRAGTDSGKVADIVESVLADATREHDENERRHVADIEAAAANPPPPPRHASPPG